MIDFLAQNAGLIGLIFFVTFFIGMLFWLFRPGAKQQYLTYGYIPLKEAQDDERV